jgi:hypothetical protein
MEVWTGRRGQGIGHYNHVTLHLSNFLSAAIWKLSCMLHKPAMANISKGEVSMHAVRAHNEQFTSFSFIDNNVYVSFVLNGGHNEHTRKQVFQAPNTPYDSRITVHSAVSISLVAKSMRTWDKSVAIFSGPLWTIMNCVVTLYCHVRGAYRSPSAKFCRKCYRLNASYIICDICCA